MNTVTPETVDPRNLPELMDQEEPADYEVTLDLTPAHLHTDEDGGWEIRNEDGVTMAIGSLHTLLRRDGTPIEQQLTHLTLMAAAPHLLQLLIKLLSGAEEGVSDDAREYVANLLVDMVVP